MPRPISSEELELIEEVYIDETSQTGQRSLVIGGITIPHRLSEQFAEDILEARRPKLAAERPGSDELREMKWSDVGKGDFEAYKRVVDAYFDFADKHIKGEKGAVEFHCSVVNTQVRGRTYSGSRGKKALTNAFYKHCFDVALYHKNNLFHFYLDRRHSDDRKAAIYDNFLRNWLCRSMATRGTRRSFAARRLKSCHSHELQGLQVADLLIGAVAFRLNRHYDADNANPDKKLLCEYVLRRGALWDYINVERGTYRQKKTGRFQLWQQRIAEAIRNPPIRKPTERPSS